MIRYIMLFAISRFTVEKGDCSYWIISNCSFNQTNINLPMIFFSFFFLKKKLLFLIQDIFFSIIGKAEFKK
jgi:hypothetical protein